MPPRFHLDPAGDEAWRSGQALSLPPAAARHAQVLRLQPGSAVLLFDGRGGQWHAEVAQMTRSGVSVLLREHEAVERELALSVTLAVCMPANDRMDDLVEKATELGVAAIVPLMSERSVLRLQGERAQRKQAHWQAVAAAASEQCGRNRVPDVHPVSTLEAWLAGQPAALMRAESSGIDRWQLSLDAQARPLADAWRRLAAPTPRALHILSGPEGGLNPAEQARAESAGFRPVSLGPRILRADTAPLAALAALAALPVPAATTATAASSSADGEPPP